MKIIQYVKISYLSIQKEGIFECIHALLSTKVIFIKRSIYFFLKSSVMKEKYGEIVDVVEKENVITMVRKLS